MQRAGNAAARSFSSLNEVADVFLLIAHKGAIGNPSGHPRVREDGEDLSHGRGSHSKPYCDQLRLGEVPRRASPASG
jgi:hypothetical protein